MKKRYQTLAVLLCTVSTMTAAEEAAKIKALLLTGGGYHDYDNQKTILSEGLSERVGIEWTIVHKDANATKEFLKTEGWSETFDVVVYNVCFADETDGGFIESLTETHAAGLPAVIIHCSLHSYHWKVDTDAWERFIGVTSMRHGRQDPIAVTTVATDHPVVKSLPVNWATPKGELYHIDKVWDTATVLANGSIDGGKSKHAVAWTNQFGKARVFGTSIGHHNETMQDKNFLDLVANGLLWSVDRLKAK